MKLLKLQLNQKADLTYIERSLNADGYHLIAGVDEAGRGCLAGPVVAASVILPKDLIIEGLNDSKKLTPKQRDKYFDIIKEESISWSWERIDAPEIDRINILQASLEAMRISVLKLKVEPQILLIDGPYSINCRKLQKGIKKGDARSQSIAAASVVAKVVRDRIMCDYKGEYPGFSFDIHKGYGTSLHLKELEKHGPTPIHRRSFRHVVTSD
jgi:ribonuclease HII